MSIQSLYKALIYGFALGHPQHIIICGDLGVMLQLPDQPDGYVLHGAVVVVHRCWLPIFPEGDVFYPRQDKVRVTPANKRKSIHRAAHKLGADKLLGSLAVAESRHESTQALRLRIHRKQRLIDKSQRRPACPGKGGHLAHPVLQQSQHSAASWVRPKGRCVTSNKLGNMAKAVGHTGGLSLGVLSNT